MPDQEKPDAAQLADAVERLLAAVSEDTSSTADRMIRARLEGYAAGLRDADERRQPSSWPHGMKGARSCDTE